MPKRIPHSDLEIITGQETTQDYLEMQKKLGRFYLRGFLRMLARQKKTGHFLEVGCGPGYQTAEVAKENPNAHITAIEPSVDMLTVAKSYIKQQGLSQRVRFFQGTVEDKALIKDLGRFDLIYSTFSLHHWHDPVKGIEHLYRALNDKGILLIYDFERHWATYYLPIKRGIIESIRASYTPGEIAAMIAGLDAGKHAVRRHFPYLSIILNRG
jgi:ubiquinone/menaquinone biosynthesis C-methylase UbiE